MKKLFKTIWNGIKGYFREMVTTMKPMTPKERWVHFWEYYWGLVAALACVAFIGLVIGTGIYNANQNVLCSGALANVDIGVETQDFLQQDFLESLGGTPKKDRVDISNLVFGDLNSAEDAEYNYNASMTVLAMVAAQELDYIMTDQYALEYYINQGIFRDLREFFTAEEMETWKSRVIYAQPEGETEMYPVAINLTGTAFAEKYLLGKADYYLSFSITSQRPEACRAFWEYLMALEA